MAELHSDADREASSAGAWGDKAARPVSSAQELAEVRDEAGWSTQDVAARLRLNPRQMFALETGNWDALPGRAYTRALLRSYGRLLGVDTTPLLESVGPVPGAEQLRTPADAHAMPQRPAIGYGRTSSGRPWVAPALSVAAIAMAAAGVFSLLDDSAAPSSSERSGGSVRAVELPALTASDSRLLSTAPALIGVGPGPLRNDAAAASADGVAGEAVRPGGRASSTLPVMPLDRIQVTPATVGVPLASPVADASVQPSSASPASGSPARTTPGDSAPSLADAPVGTLAAASAARAAVAPRTPQPVQLSIKRPTWVDIRDADGEKLVFGNQKAGRNLSVSGLPPISVVIGNPDATELRYRGEIIDLRERAQRGVSRFTLE